MVEDRKRLVRVYKPRPKGMKWATGSKARQAFGKQTLWHYLRLGKTIARPRRVTHKFAPPKLRQHLHVWGVLTNGQLFKILRRHPEATKMKGHAMREGTLKGDGTKSATHLTLPELYVLADRLLREMDEIDEELGGGAAPNGQRLTKREFKELRAKRIKRKGLLVTQYRTLKRVIAEKHRATYTIGKEPVK